MVKELLSIVDPLRQLRLEMVCMVVLLSSCDSGRGRGHIRTTVYNLPMQAALSAWKKVDFHKAGAGLTPGVNSHAWKDTVRIYNTSKTNLPGARRQNHWRLQSPGVFL